MSVAGTVCRLTENTLKDDRKEVVFFPYKASMWDSLESVYLAAAEDPGVIHADSVIVESESVRKAYIKIMTKYFGESTGPVWEQKILGLGSPKLDRVASKSRDDLTIPESWEKIIRKPDGTRKKVVFYNNSVSPMINMADKMLRKIEDTLLFLKIIKMRQLFFGGRIP